MPQLAKGGKHVYGWSRVGESGMIVIPPEALKEYHFKDSDRLVLLRGSKASGGFALGSLQAIDRSVLGTVFGSHSEPIDPQPPNGQVLGQIERPLSSVHLQGGAVEIPVTTLAKYGIRVGDVLLVVRGSSLAIAFALRGRIVDEARRHPELQVFVCPDRVGPS